jgi:hypothetical protein
MLFQVSPTSVGLETNRLADAMKQWVSPEQKEKLDARGIFDLNSLPRGLKDMTPCPDIRKASFGSRQLKRHTVPSSSLIFVHAIETHR